MFDDAELTSPDAGGSNSIGGSVASAGTEAASGSAAGGTKTSGGSSANGGGAAGSNEGGSAGSATNGGTDPGEAGKGGKTAGGGGTGGSTNPEPDPITIEITDIEDTYVSACDPYDSAGNQESFSIDGSSCVTQALINPSIAGIPAGAIVTKATLTLTCINVGGMLAVSYANEAWVETTVRWNNKPEMGASLGTLGCEVEGGQVMLELTEAVQQWLDGANPYGIYLRTENNDGTDFASSESDIESARPLFTVTYKPPVK